MISGDGVIPLSRSIAGVHTAEEPDHRLHRSLVRGSAGGQTVGPHCSSLHTQVRHLLTLVV